MIFYYIYINIIKIISSQIYSINNKKDILISNEIKNLLSNENLSKLNLNNNYTLKNFISDEVIIDINSSFKNSLFSQNNEYAFMNYNFFQTYFNGEKIEASFEYSMANYSYESYNIYNNNSKNKNFHKNKKYDCHIYYGQNDFKLNDVFQNFFSIKKILNINKLILILSNEGKLYSTSNYQYYNLFFINQKDNTNNCFIETINDFFISNNYLIIITESKICFYYLNLIFPNNDKRINNYKISASFLNHINNNNKKILNQIKIKDNHIYLSYKSEKNIRKYFVQQNLNDRNYINFTYNGVTNEFIDFIINENTLYVIEEKIGLIIFSIKNGTILKKINISSAINIDKFINPFTGKSFIGIYLNNSRYDEFFIELLIENENMPIINKILLYRDNNHYNFSNYLTFDGLFTYFLDNANNNLIIIRRGLISNISFYSYIIPINNNNITNLSNYIISLYRKINTYNFLPVLISKNNNLVFTYSNFIFKKNLLNCFFYEKGYYSISVNYLSETCSNLKNDFCLITTVYKYRVIGNIENLIFIKFIICILVIIIVNVGLFICYIIYRMKKNKKSLFLLKNKDLLNKKKEYLYLQNENDYNIKNNNKIETKQFKKNHKLNIEDSEVKFGKSSFSNHLKDIFNNDNLNNLNNDENFNKNNRINTYFPEKNQNLNDENNFNNYKNSENVYSNNEKIYKKLKKIDIKKLNIEENN